MTSVTDWEWDPRDLEPVVRKLSMLILLAIVLCTSAAHATSFAPPVDGPVGRRFESPADEFAQGHRGIDYVVASGTSVRAIGSGHVLFAGPVPGGWAVTVDHADGVVSTYSILSDVSVTAGETVERGEWVGRSGEAHPGIEGLHLGIKSHDRYVDPMTYLGALDVAGAIHLAPLQDDDVLKVAGVQRCRDGEGGSSRIAPNENIVVEVAGIASHTEGGVSAPLYTDGATRLGYSPERVYEFSYRGVGETELHDPYRATDTLGDLNDAAERLRELLVAVGKRHPGSRVDVLAHSQGGLVVRALLDDLADTWHPLVPAIDHVVTFSTPHRGAPLAAEVDDLADSTLTGKAALSLLSSWSRSGGPLPDPTSVAVAQLEPGSRFLEEMAREDIAFGTRLLALTTPHDVIVPADHALVDDHPGRVVGPSGINGHSAIVGSDEAWGLARAFLQDAPLGCPGVWDELGPWAGRAISFLEGMVDHVYSTGERALGRGPLGVARKAGSTIGRLIKGT